MHDHCVYKTSHPSGLFYLGKGMTKKVVSGKYKGSGIKLTRLWQSKFPKNEWTTEIIETFENAQDAYQREAEMIQKLKADINCVNLADGGIGGSGMRGRKHSDATREKMRQSALAICATEQAKMARSEGIRRSWADPIVKTRRIAQMNTTTAKTNRSEAGRSRWAKAPKNRTIEIVSDCGEVVYTFGSVQAAAAFLQCSKTNIYSAARTNRKIGRRLVTLKDQFFVRLS